MAYITSERISEIRREIKVLFPDFKFSITRDNHSGVSISILEAPIPLTDKEYEQVNVYYAKDIKDVEKRSVIEKILSIAEKGVKYYETGDYGSQPSHYTYITIGQWDRPFKLILNNQNGKAIASMKIKKQLTVS